MQHAPSDCGRSGTECQARLLQASCQRLTLSAGHSTAALCLVLLPRGPSGEPAVLTDVVWRSVSRPLVILRRQRQPPQTAQQWGDPLAFGSRPRPLDQVPHIAALAAGPESSAAESGRIQSHDGAVAPAASAQGDAHSAEQKGEKTPAAQPVFVPALAPGAPAVAIGPNPSQFTSAAQAAHPPQLPAAEPVDWTACLREDDTDTPFTVEDFTAAQPARSDCPGGLKTTGLHHEHGLMLVELFVCLCCCGAVGEGTLLSWAAG